jgi:hypothetical protein
MVWFEYKNVSNFVSCRCRCGLANFLCLWNNVINFVNNLPPPGSVFASTVLWIV